MRWENLLGIFIANEYIVTYIQLILEPNNDPSEVHIDKQSSNNQTKEEPMDTKLNVKQWSLASLVVFVIKTATAFIVRRIWVIPVSPGQVETVADPMVGRISIYLSRLVLAGLLTYIFTKTNFKGKSGLGHGIRFGFGMGLVMFVPGFITGIVYTNLSIASQASFMVVEVIQYVICGAAMAYFYKSNEAAAK